MRPRSAAAIASASRASQIRSDFAKRANPRVLKTRIDSPTVLNYSTVNYEHQECMEASLTLARHFSQAPIAHRTNPTMSLTSAMIGAAIMRARRAPSASMRSISAGSLPRRFISDVIGDNFSTAISASAFLKYEK